MCGRAPTSPGARIIGTHGSIRGSRATASSSKGETQDQNQKSVGASAAQTTHGHRGIRSAEPWWTPAPPHELARRWPGSRQDGVRAAMSRQCREAAWGGGGIFVAFEESPGQIIANSATFDWGLASLGAKRLFMMDAHLSPTLVKTGDFDLAGMLAMLAAKKQEIDAQWIVFDGIDVLLTLLQDPVAEMRELYRLRDWLADNALTAIVTAKSEGRSSEATHYGFLQFMVDCVVRLDRRLEDRVSVQTVRITKYRGSGFAAAEFPLSFGSSGIEVGAIEPAGIGRRASTEKLSAGFEQLDVMLGGGV